MLVERPLLVPELSQPLLDAIVLHPDLIQQLQPHRLHAALDQPDLVSRSARDGVLEIAAGDTLDHLGGALQRGGEPPAQHDREHDLHREDHRHEQRGARVDRELVQDPKHERHRQERACDKRHGVLGRDRGSSLELRMDILDPRIRSAFRDVLRRCHCADKGPGVGGRRRAGAGRTRPGPRVVFGVSSGDPDARFTLAARRRSSPR